MSLLVVKPGMLASVQDLGRHGHRQLGICPGGALDALALTLANRLVGNADGAAGLELTLGGCEIRFEQDTRIALAGEAFGAMLDGKVRFLKGGAEVLPGVEAVATPGHTPGHLSFLIHGSEPVLIAGDAISNAIVSFAHPAWPTASDHDPQQGAATRVSLLDRLAGDKARVIGFHFPHPGAGAVERKDGAYVYVPV